MCILFIYVNSGHGGDGDPVFGEYRLVLASNRDEYYARPAMIAGPWEESPHVIGGRDMEPGREGGTWLAIGSSPLTSGTIRVGALLNVTGENKPNVTSGRGPIVADYVSGSVSNDEYSRELLAKDCYGAFNFVSVEMDRTGTSVLHASNAPSGIDRCELTTALGFGNSTMDVPLEKVRHGRKRFGDIVDKHLKVTNQDKPVLVEELLGLLKSNDKYFPDKELSRRAPAHAEELASINVRFPEAGYGSRTRTVILVDHQNKMDFYEETMVSTDPEGEWKMTHIERQF